MNINITIDDNILTNLSNGAKNQLNKQTEIYIKELLKEANLIEEGIRENEANSEITSNIIMQAVRKNKNYIEKKTPTWLKICKIVSSISCVITGFLFDINGYQNNAKGLIGFIICFAVACSSTVTMHIKES